MQEVPLFVANQFGGRLRRRGPCRAERLEDATFGPIRSEQVGLDVLARDPRRQPAPVGTQLAQSRTTLQLTRVDELHHGAHVGVITQVAQPSEVVPRALPREQVPQVVVLGGDADPAVLVEDAAHERRATAADTHDEDGFGLAGDAPDRVVHVLRSLAVAA